MVNLRKFDICPDVAAHIFRCTRMQFRAAKLIASSLVNQGGPMEATLSAELTLPRHSCKNSKQV